MRHLSGYSRASLRNQEFRESLLHVYVHLRLSLLLCRTRLGHWLRPHSVLDGEIEVRSLRIASEALSEEVSIISNLLLFHGLDHKLSGMLSHLLHGETPFFESL